MLPLHQSPGRGHCRRFRPTFDANMCSCRGNRPTITSYAYLLGAYLGDGYLSHGPGQLLVVCDRQYPGIIEECPRGDDPHEFAPARRHLAASRPQLRPRRRAAGKAGSRPSRSTGADASTSGRSCSSRGRRRSSRRTRGNSCAACCIRTAAARSIASRPSSRAGGSREYEYPRWFFSNMSADIRGLFCTTCEQLGLRWTQSNHRNISISHRHSVALLEEHVGPKT